MRPALRAVFTVISLAIMGLTCWVWIMAVPGPLGAAGHGYMERVLSQILMTFLLLLVGAGSVLLTLAGFRALERARPPRTRSRSHE